MFCAISGSVPNEPVVNKKSGHLFERKLVEKYIQETGKDPVTQEEATLDDLLPLASNKLVKPRPSAAASIPGMLGLFHDEWDALMLGTYQLRQQLHTARQELSHSLYQHDAACRVIARLLRERDEARAALESVREQVKAELAAKRDAGEPMDADEQEPKRAKLAGIPAEVMDDMHHVSQELSKGRKKRAVPEGTATAEEVAAYSVIASPALHKVSQPGITALDLQPGADHVVATAGADAKVEVYDLQQQRTLADLAGHSKKVTALQFATADVLLTASADKTVRVWRGEGESWACAATLAEHTKEVVGLTVHPSHRYFVSASADGTWAFCDIATAQSYKQVALEAGGYSACAFHPDGIILGTGTSDRVVRIWEAKSCKNVANFEGHTGPVVSLSFSENGYQLATASTDGIKLWDLRKLKNFKALAPYDSAPTSCVCYDYSGLYLAVGGPDVRVYSTKQDFAQVVAFSDMPKKGVSAVRWGSRAASLLVGAADHKLRVLGSAP